MQALAKVLEGAGHRDRDAQFRYIAARAREDMDAGQPVVPVDAKKREQVGDYAQPGREWHAAGSPPQVLDHSFPDRDGPGHAIPYGIYDIAANAGFVNAGTDATRLLVTCDAGSSSGTRNRAWKKELAAFAGQAGLEITVCHFPPGTSQWNKIEHRLFSQVSLAWRGRPLTSYDVIISTISAITTRTGLTATAVLDQRPYPAGQEISDAEIRDIQDRCLTRHAFRGNWNYTVLPQPRPAPTPAPQRPAPPRVPAATLNHPALTGMDPAALLTWTRAPETTLAAPGGPAPGTRRGPEPRLTAADLITAARIRAHLSLPLTLLAPLLGVDPSGLRRKLRPATAAIAASAHPPPAAPPPAEPPRTRTGLLAHAAAHGIDLTIPPPAQAHTPPQAILEPPDTPQADLIWERLHNTKKAP